MGQNIDRFCEDLREKLTEADGWLNDLKARVEGDVDTAARNIRSRLEEVRDRAALNHQKVVDARASVASWLDEKKATAVGDVEGWKTRREIAHLEHRAERAEDYAEAAIIVAAAALDDAEQAVLEAWEARADADMAATFT